jgi:radical SAM superfamily enzyme YgiQ (UPF0313 family)
MKRVILIRPFYKEVLKQQTFPLGLGYLAAVLRKNNYWVRIYDLNVLRITNKDFVNYLQNLKVDFIGITALSWYYNAMVEICKLFKQNDKYRGVPLIIGGVHVSSLPEFSLRETGADAIVIGEGEVTLVDLLNTLSLEGDLANVAGIGYLKDGIYQQTEPRELIDNLDELPFPAWDLIHPELYPSIPHGSFYKKGPVFPVFTSRGCPFECSYCASQNFWKHCIRYHSVHRIVDEIEFLVNKYGAREIHIWDDNFTLNNRRVVEFCKEIKRRKLNLYFACPNGVKVDTLDETLLKIMRDAGFYSLIFAIETGSKRVLKNIKKNIRLEKVPSIISSAKKYRYLTRAFFIFGLPSEKIQDVYTTSELALNLKLDLANFFMFTPLPGSSFFYEWLETKKVKDLRWDYDFFNNPQDMTGFNEIDQKIMFKLQKYLYIKFYLLRPWKLISYILRIKIAQYIIFFNRLLYAFGFY